MAQTVEERAAYLRKWRANNKERVAQYNKNRDPEDKKRYNTEYYLKNKQNMIDTASQWEKDNPERTFRRRKAKGANRTAKNLGISGRLVVANIDTLVEDNPMACHYCDVGLSKNEWQIDHVIPMRDKGSNTLDNIVICCKNCNEQKHWKSKEEFLTKKGN